MPTGQQVINAALTSLSMLEQGGVPSGSDSNDSLNELNTLWDGWGIDEGLIYAISTAQYALTQNIGTYGMGPTAAPPFNVTAPSRIYRAVFLLSGGRNELKVVDNGQYFSHNDLAAKAVAPDELYPDYNVDPATGNITLYMWPIATVSGASLELETGAPFKAWTLTTVYHLPQGYQDAVQECLAFRLLSHFGVAVAQEIAVLVTAKAKAAEARIRAMNAFNRKLPPGATAQPTAEPVAAGGAGKG